MKATKLLSITALIAFSVVLTACHKDSTKPSQSKYFPNDAGDSWVYAVTDSAQSSPGNPSLTLHYDVTVRIVGNVKLPDGKNASLWVYTFPSAVDTNYVRVVGDTIEFFDNSSSKTVAGLAFPSLTFLVPFHMGLRWNGKLYGLDTSRVINQTNVSTGFGSIFTGCFDVYLHYIGPNTELKDHYLIEPNVGIVQKSFNHYVNGPIIYQSWQLKSFTIK